MANETNSTTTSTPNNLEPAAEDTAMMRCPCCGKNTLRTPLNVNHELMDHYMSCVMTGVPFWHDYPLYNGKIILRITMLDKNRQQLLDRISLVLEMLGDSTDSQQEKLKVNQLRVLLRNLLHIEHVKMANGPSMKVWSVATSLEDKISAILEQEDQKAHHISADAFNELYDLCHNPAVVTGLSEQLISVAIDTHYRLSSILIAAGIDENFWDGIELA